MRLESSGLRKPGGTGTGPREVAGGDCGLGRGAGQGARGCGDEVALDGDEANEVAVGVAELVRDQRSSGARAREAGRSSWWCPF